MSLKGKISFAAVSILFMSAVFFALYMPDITARGVESGVSCALEVLLPSLFPFMFLSAFAANYGISDAAGRLLSPITEKLLKLPREAGVTVLLGFVGGYPVGAIGISRLLRQGKISQRTAQRMLCFCVNPGPAFLISAVGEGMYGSRLSGLILFASQTAASFITAVVLGFLADDSDVTSPISRRKNERLTFSDAFVLSSRSACSSAVTLCTLVVLFSAFEALLFEAVNIDRESFVGAALRSLLEVTDGCAAAAENRLPLWAAAFIVAWGGLCVHFQIFAVMESAVSKPIFAVSRIISGALSSGMAYLAMRYINIETAVFSNIEESRAELSSTAGVGSAALLFSSVMLLLFISEPKEELYVRNSRPILGE